jgi:hypothetical protein
MKGNWVFPLIVGVLVGVVLARWSDIVNLVEHRQQLEGASKISEGLKDLGLSS